MSLIIDYCVISKYYFSLFTILFSRDELFDLIKRNFINLTKNNVPIYGISKSKNLSDFVTNESDVKKGKTRIPLKLARIYDEDLLSEDQMGRS